MAEVKANVASARPDSTADKQAIPKKLLQFEKRSGDVDYIIPKSKMLRSWPSQKSEDYSSKPHARFYSVGPSTHKIMCPLCIQIADTETAQMRGALGQLSCLLSTLSCCFPIFSLSFVYFCLQSRLKSKRLFCNKCGGHLGFYWRPT